MLSDTSETDGDDTRSQILETQDSLGDLGSWSDASRGHKDVPGIHNGTNYEVGYENRVREVINGLHMNAVKDRKRVVKLRVRSRCYRRSS